MEELKYKCRRSECIKPASEGHACCSTRCRAMIPTCNEPGCKNATEPCIVKGSSCYYSLKCYSHGGGIIWDGEFSGYKRKKSPYVFVEGTWIQKYHSTIELEATDRQPKDLGYSTCVRSILN